MKTIKKGMVLFNLFLVCAGFALGSVVAAVSADIPGLNWLSCGFHIGTFSFNLIKLALEVNLRFTVASAVFIVLALLTGRLICRKRDLVK